MKAFKKLIFVFIFILLGIQISCASCNIIGPGGDVFIGEQGLCYEQ